MIWKSSLEKYPEHVNAIGMISVENGNLEMSLADLLSASLTISKRLAHAIYFAPRASALRIEILEAAAGVELAPSKRRNPDSELERQKREALAQVQRLAKRSRAAIQKRHDVIHDAWGVDDEDEGRPVIRQRIGEAAFKDAVPVPIEELQSLVRTFRILIDEIQLLVAFFREHPPTMVSLKKASTKSGDSARAVSIGKPSSRKN